MVITVDGVACAGATESRPAAATRVVVASTKGTRFFAKVILLSSSSADTASVLQVQFHGGLTLSIVGLDNITCGLEDPERDDRKDKHRDEEKSSYGHSISVLVRYESRLVHIQTGHHRRIRKAHRLLAAR